MFILKTKNVLLSVIGMLGLIEVINFNASTSIGVASSIIKISIFAAIFYLVYRYVLVDSDEQKEEIGILYDKLEKDVATGVFDKKALYDWYEIKKGYIKKTDKDLSIVIVEINNYEKIKQEKTKEETETIVCEMADLVNGSVRKMIDFVVRIDENKFAILCFEKEKNALIIAKRIDKKVREKNWSHAENITSVIAVSEIDLENEFEVELTYAERVLYDARNADLIKIATRHTN